MFHQHALALREKGVDAEIWYGKVSPANSLISKSSSQVENGVPTTRFTAWSPPRINPSLIKTSLEKFATGLENHFSKFGSPDIIHAQGYLAASAVALLHKRKPIPFIYTERSSVWLNAQVPGKMMPWIHGALSGASMITAVSPGLAKTLSIQTNREIKIMPPWFDEEIFYPGQTPDTNPFIWISAGEPAKIKGLRELITAFAEFVKQHTTVSTRLILADEIDDKEELIKLAKAQNVSDKIDFVGLLSQDKLAELMRKSHVYISSSKVETFGKAMAEAQACGLPLISTPTAGGNYIIDTTKGGIVTKDFTSDSILQTMETVYDQYASFKGNEISTRAYAFSKQNLLPEWIAHYNALLS